MENWLESDPNIIINSANAFEVLSSETNIDFTGIWNRLGQAVYRVDSWNGTDESLTKGLVATLNHCQEEIYKDLPLHIIETISNTNPIEPSENGEDEERDIDRKVVKDWVSGVLTLLLYYRSANLEEEIDKFRVPGGVQFYIEMLTELSKNPVALDFTGYFKPQSDPQDIIDELVAISEDPGFSVLHGNCIHTMTRIDIDWPWTNLIQSLKNKLETVDNLNPVVTRASIISFYILLNEKNISDAENTLNQLSTNGYLLHHLSYVISKKDYDAAAACILPIMEFNPGASVSTEVGNSTAGVKKFLEICKDPNTSPKIIERLYVLVLSLNRTQDLITQGANESPIDPLLKSILEKTALSEDVNQHITSTMIIDDFDILEELLSEDALSNLVKESIAKANLLSELIDKDFDRDLASLYLISYQEAKEQQQKEYVDFLIAGLQLTDTLAWSSELSNPSDLWKLFQTLVQDNISLNLKDKFYDAILNNADKLRNDESALNSSELLRALDSASQDTFMRNLRDKVIIVATADGDVVPYINFWGDELIARGFLEAKAKADDVCRHLLIRFLSSNDINKIKWVSKALATNEKLLDGAEGASVEELKNKTEDLLRDPAVESTTREELIKIAGIIGVDIPQIEHEEVSEEEENGDEVDSENESDT